MDKNKGTFVVGDDEPSTEEFDIHNVVGTSLIGISAPGVCLFRLVRAGGFLPS